MLGGRENQTQMIPFEYPEADNVDRAKVNRAIVKSKIKCFTSESKIIIARNHFICKDNAIIVKIPELRYESQLTQYWGRQRETGI